MATKLFLYQTNDKVGRRQYPISAGDNLMMLMDLNSKGLCIDSPQIRGKELEEFTRKFNILTNEELRKSLEIDTIQFTSVMNQCVQCVGCRRRVERLFLHLSTTEYPTVDPLVLRTITDSDSNKLILTIIDDKLKTPQALGTLFYRHHEVLNNLLDSKLRNKTRCILHSLDAFRSRPFSESWREVWSAMKQNCRDEISTIEFKELRGVLEDYRKKHKFCQGCRTKIDKAYNLLIAEPTAKEKGFIPALYSNFKRCTTHVHLATNRLDFFDALIRRAEPEVTLTYSKQRERHAKTLEIAQEEVLTCVGMMVYQRLRRIYVNLREEERACQVLAAVGVHALYRNFDMTVEKKQGMSNLELLYKEMSRAERAKELKREQKKLKKKKKRIEKKNILKLNCNNDEIDDDDIDDEEERDLEVCEDELTSIIKDETEENDQKSSDRETPFSLTTDSDIEHVCGLEDEIEIDNVETLTSVPMDVKSSKAKSRNKQKTPKKQKQKQSKRKNVKKRTTDISSCSSNPDDNNNCKNNDNMNEVNTKVKIIVDTSVIKCNQCLSPSNVCPCDNEIKDAGYGSESYSHEISRFSSELSSHEGSEVSCSDDFCNHLNNNSESDHSEIDEGKMISNNTNIPIDLRWQGNEYLCNSYFGDHNAKLLSLEQMLNDFDDEEDNCYIPHEVVMQFQCQQKRVQEQRMKLREQIREKFAHYICQNSIQKLLFKTQNSPLQLVS